MKRSLSISIVALTLLGGCRESGPSSGLPIVQMPIGSRTFKLEVANTSESQEKGLMKRDSMPEDHGMIFVFDKPRVMRFWMRNTRFPLDIIYLDDGGRVVSIKQLKAYDETAVSSDALANYAIELNKGAAAAAGVKIGDVLKIPAEISAPP